MLSTFQLSNLARKVPEHRLQEAPKDEPQTEEIQERLAKTQLTKDSFGSLSSSTTLSWNGSLSVAGSSGPSSGYGTLSDMSDMRNSKRTSLIRRPENKESQATGITRVEHWNAPVDEELGFPAAVAARLNGLRTPEAQNASANVLDYFASKNPPSVPRNALSTAARPPTPPKSELDLLPKPVETVRRKKKGFRAPIPQQMKPTPANVKITRLADLPPTPDTSNNASPLPQPFETNRRRHKPRPLNADKDKNYKRSNVTRKPEDSGEPEEHELPQPFTSSRWSNMVIQKARHLRRTSTSKPDDKGLFYFVPEADRNVKGLSKRSPIPGRWVTPDNQVSHWQEPIDSAPPSPHEGSPSSSVCPSLTTSPTNSVTSINSVAHRKPRGIEGRRESLDEGFGSFIGEIQRSKIEKKRNRAAATQEDDGQLTETDDDPSRGRNMRRRARENTVKAAKEDSSPSTAALEDDYPIYHSPTRADIRRPEKIDYDSPEAAAKFSILLPPVRPAKPAPATAAPAPVATPAIARPAAPSLLSLPEIRVLSTTQGQLTTSPGITVASLPPRRNTVSPPSADDAEAEADDVFVSNLYRYLSFNVPSIAKMYDEELADYTGLSQDDVEADRKEALTVYLKKWLREHPDFRGGERYKGGLW